VVIGEGVRIPVEVRGRKRETMRAVTVYRLDYGVDAGYRTRHPIGSVLERRKRERGNNFDDLSRLARRLFVLDTADVVHIVIDVGKSGG